MPTTLSFNVDEQIEVKQSYDALLREYIDHSGSELMSVSLVWRVLMLAWALRLVSRLLSWVP